MNCYTRKQTVRIMTILFSHGAKRKILLMEMIFGRTVHFYKEIEEGGGERRSLMVPNIRKFKYPFNDSDTGLIFV